MINTNYNFYKMQRLKNKRRESVMKFVNFVALSSSSLDNKVNEFLQENVHIEIVKMDFQMSSLAVGVGICYEDVKRER